MDKLTQLVVDYKQSKDESIILSIQRIIFPIINKLVTKWKFNSFPVLIKEHIMDEAYTTILTDAINLFDETKGSKFSSIYATRLNFILRAEYMKFFQKGKPIQKRYGRLHEYSIHRKYDDEQTLEDVLKHDSDIREEIQNNFLNSALELLNPKEKSLIESLYFNKQPKSKIKEIHNLTQRDLDKQEVQILNKLKGLI